MQRSKLYVAAVAAALILISLLTGFASSITGYAATTVYSDVIDDLRADSTFNVEDYPAVDNDYGIYVVQVGESEQGNLYVYTYQPCERKRPLIATRINMSLTDSVDDTELYGLSLINKNGVFAKYRVQSVTVRGNTVLRYYNVSSIYRGFIDGIDDPPLSDNTVNEKAFAVGKLFYVMTQPDGSVVYNLDPTYVVKIINPVSSYITVQNSSTSGSTSLWGDYKKYQYTDMHYVAFSTDWNIDRLISADVHYAYCPGEFRDNDFLWWDINSWTKYGDEKETTARLECTDSYDVTYKNKWGLFTLGKKHYTWDKIYSVDGFCADVAANTDYSDSTLNAIRNEVSGREWVLLFDTTERKTVKDNDAGLISKTTTFTKVDKVSVLRLEFETDGVYYNLGAVSDTVSAPYPEPTQPGEKGRNKSFWERLADVLGVPVVVAKVIFWFVFALVAVIVTVLICVFVPGALPVIGKALLAVLKAVAVALKWLCIGLAYLLYYLLYGLWRIACAPVKLISNAVKARKDKSETGKRAATAGTGRTGNRRRSERKTKPKKPKRSKPHVKTKTKKAGK